MSKDQRELVAEIRRRAEAQGLLVRVEPARGKGSHCRVYVGSRFTTVPAKVKTGTRRAIFKQLDLD